MINRTTKLRWRRRFRYRKRQVEDISSQAEDHLDRHFFRRLSRLADVRRFVISWVLLLILLIAIVILQIRGLGNYYLHTQPLPGGTYTEGILGSFTNANPLYATGSVDSDVARLVFAGLLKYDQNNHLVGDLANKWEVDEHGVRYTVHLRPNLTWQDGQSLTAADVAFTYHIIQNPDAKSPLASSWQGISVIAQDAHTVVFTLPNPLSSFPYSLTNGIVPQHSLASFPTAQLRSINFNTANPMGSGPFKWQAIEVHGDTPATREQRIALVPNEHYYGGKPKLDKFIIRSFHDEKQLLDSFRKQELNSVAGLEKLPADLEKDSSIHTYNLSLTSEVLVFFETNQAILKDAAVRRALLQATDTNQVLGGLGYPVIAAHEPLLQSDVGYDKTLAQAGFNLAAAWQILDQAGWKTSPDGIRMKDGKPLSLTLYSQNTAEYQSVTSTIEKQWRAAGVKVETVLQSDTDIQGNLVRHDYDVLIYGIALGVDPDVFAYWHSSQADPRSSHLNLSDYKSGAADKALEAGRTRTDAVLRTIKYKPFLQAWHDDVPAIALYQPRLLYVTHGQLFGFDERSLNSGADRYANVNNWMIRQTKAAK